MQPSRNASNMKIINVFTVSGVLATRVSILRRMRPLVDAKPVLIANSQLLGFINSKDDP